jgi:peptidoglycan-N-acetylglucosamine deacetylase
MRLFRPCFFAGWLYPDSIFRIKTSVKLLCLTFDDGPDPESTPVLLKILSKYNIKAVFFCDGRAAEKYPELVKQIVSEGHLIGNHGYTHPDGWKKSKESYLSDILTAEPFTSGKLFRPPYGHLRLDQYRKLKEKFRIVFWDIMPYDFDNSFGPDNSLLILRKKIRPGSIIVLHDTSHSAANKIIEEFIIYSLKEGYGFSFF